MTQFHITVASVSWRSSAFLYDLFINLLALAEQPETICFLVADNTGGTDDKLRALGVPGLTIVPVDTSGEHMSVAHAIGLNALMTHLETPYALIVDPDVAMFRAGWDSVLQVMLDSHDTVAAGAPYPGWKLGKYHDFPSPPLAFWQTDKLLSLVPDWRPYARSVGGRSADLVRRQLLQASKFLDRNVLRLPPRRYLIGHRVEQLVGIASKDTGWEIADRARTREWRACVFEEARTPDDLGALPADQREQYRPLINEFELYAYEGRPFVAHLQSTQRGISFALWTSHTVSLYRNQSNKAIRLARWYEILALLLPEYKRAM